MKINEILAVDMYEQGLLEVQEYLNSKNILQEGYAASDVYNNLCNSQLTTVSPAVGESVALMQLLGVPTGKVVIIQGFEKLYKLLRIRTVDELTRYEFNVDGKVLIYPGNYQAGDQLSKTFFYYSADALHQDKTLVHLALADWEIRDRI